MRPQGLYFFRGATTGIREMDGLNSSIRRIILCLGELQNAEAHLFSHCGFVRQRVVRGKPVGTWKLDTAKSKFSRGDLPNDVTLVIEHKGDDLQVSASGTNADGSPLSIKYTIPEKGGTGQIPESAAYDGISSKVVSPEVRENTYTKNGKIVTTRHNVVSKDGKTMRSTVKGIKAQGKSISGTEVFEKQ